MPEQGYLTTHILDTARGCPAAGVTIELYRLDSNNRQLLATAVSNHDGRTDQPLIAKGKLSTGIYELVFEMGNYFKAIAPDGPYPFIDSVPVRFGVDDETSHYHVPLLASPFSFSTYRGS